MLNRTAVIKQLNSVAAQIFPDKRHELHSLDKLWHLLLHNPELAQSVQDSCAHVQGLPSWDVQAKPFEAYEASKRYTIVAVDGSQIYPDKHQGTDCFLINIARVVINYGIRDSAVLLTSEPRVFANSTRRSAQMQTEGVNHLRFGLELEAIRDTAFELVHDQPHNTGIVALIDGSLMFWYVANAHGMDIGYVQQYLITLQQLHDAQIVHAGYISLPRATDLIRFAVAAHPHMYPGDESMDYDYCVDTDIFSAILEAGHATCWFKSDGALVSSYPASLQPYFCYINVGPEIARIEVPSWIATNHTHTKMLLQAIMNQADKGRGYPVSLAEAHEQAVVKGADRDFFYRTLFRVAKRPSTPGRASQKSLRKRNL